MFYLPENQEIQNCKVEIDFYSQAKHTQIASLSAIATVKLKNSILDCSKPFEFNFDKAIDCIIESTFSFLLKEEMLSNSDCTIRIIHDQVQYRYIIRDLKEHTFLFTNSSFDTSCLLSIKNTKEIAYNFISVLIPCTK